MFQGSFLKRGRVAGLANLSVRRTVSWPVFKSAASHVMRKHQSRYRNAYIILVQGGRNDMRTASAVSVTSSVWLIIVRGIVHNVQIPRLLNNQTFRTRKESQKLRRASSQQEQQENRKRKKSQPDTMDRYAPTYLLCSTCVILWELAAQEQRSCLWYTSPI